MQAPFGNWKPFKSTDEAEEVLDLGPPLVTRKIWVYQLDTGGGDITAFQLKKNIFWEAYPREGAGMLPPVSAVAPIMSVPNIVLQNKLGVFEYRIEDPGGNTIFWQRVYICINAMFFIFGGLGGASLNDFLWTEGQDRTDAYKPKRVQRIPDDYVVEIPNPPLLIAKSNVYGAPEQGVNIIYDGLPKNINDPSAPVKLFIDRGVDNGSQDGQITINWNAPNIGPPGGMQLQPGSTTRYLFTDTSAQFGQEYFYRIKAVSGSEVTYSDAISVQIFNNNHCRSEIQTMTIGGLDTVLNYKNPGQLTPDHPTYKSMLWGNRAEFGSLDPNNGNEFTDNGGIVSSWWYSPIYKFRIPNGSKLKLIMDGFSSTAFTQRGRAAEWQFSYELGNTVVGSVRTPNRVHHLVQPNANGSITIGKRIADDTGNMTSEIGHQEVIKGASGALLVRKRGGPIYALTQENNGISVYISDGMGNYDPYIYIKQDNAQKSLFNEEKGYALLDVTRKNTGEIQVLAEKGDWLFYQTSRDSWDYIYPVGRKDKDNDYRIEEDQTPGRGYMTIAAQNHRFISHDGGKHWEEQFLNGEVFRESIFDGNKLIKILDSVKYQGARYYLGESGKHLFIQKNEGPIMHVAEKRKENTYGFDLVTMKSATATLIINGLQTGQENPAHRLISYDGGKNWREQEVG